VERDPEGFELDLGDHDWDEPPPPEPPGPGGGSGGASRGVPDQGPGIGFTFLVCGILIAFTVLQMSAIGAGGPDRWWTFCLIAIPSSLLYLGVFFGGARWFGAKQAASRPQPRGRKNIT